MVGRAVSLFVIDSVASRHSVWAENDRIPCFTLLSSSPSRPYRSGKRVVGEADRGRPLSPAALFRFCH
jgi:hypothetical protein